jgi:uncharacterized membrane protein
MGTMLGFITLVAISSHLAPHLTRRDIFFGVTVSPGFREGPLALGRLYFNRADPTLFVERRMGMGYTLNLGNPWSWLVMIVFVTGIAIPLLLVP